jgi:propionate catabolism operon transcriptional regulator
MDRISTNRKPRICVFGFKGLSRLVHAVVQDFQDQASIEVVDVVLDDALDKARQIERQMTADVIVTAGANAALLRSSTKIPVISIKVSGFDVLLALLKARHIAERVGMVTYRDPIAELDAVKELLNLEISQRTYTTIDDATYCVESLHREGYRAVIGSSLAVDLAEQYGMQGFLVYSESAVRQAINDAIEIARIANLEAARYEQLNSVLHNLREAVLAVNWEGRITAINPAMERMLTINRSKAMGSLLTDLAPSLNLESVIVSGQEELEQVIQVNNITCIANRIPINEGGQRTGAVLTLQDARLIQQADTTIRTQRRSRQLAARYSFDYLTGNSPIFVAAKAAATRYAKTGSTVLITGESGTGKELFAQAIHNASMRRAGPFVAINCAAVPEPLLESELFGYEEGAFTGSRKGGKPGLFEAAHTGTIFLDEIGDMPLLLQSRFLRVLQEKEFVRLGSAQPIPIDFRVIAATHQSLPTRIERGLFRADLYYRLNILHLSLPPLRDRPEDISILALQMIYKSLRQLGASLPADQALAPMLPSMRAYAWPGNVRELENISERLAVFLSEYHHVSDIDYTLLYAEFPELFTFDNKRTSGNNSIFVRAPESISSSNLAGDEDTSQITDATIQKTLDAAKGNRSLAAQHLGISRTTLWRRLRKATDEQSR